MASLIEGYNYDIFISYRQKDNKGDRWVSEFVEALKTELESTFKEDISVYFDINPHDGLLETHDVDASLIDKLKCVVFIPIISRTYCDPKSFAWEHEFKAFIDQASKDRFGLKVKLPNGNVATRILPVQIHDLHAEDKSLLEKELGGVLRAIEFIYKELGVNKPLSDGDDDKKNLNNTKYRIQVNKVANAIDEIIHCLKGKEPAAPERKVSADMTDFVKTVEDSKNVSVPSKPVHKYMKWLIVSILLLICIIGGNFIYKGLKQKYLNPQPSSLDKSIAVLPFVNDSPDTNNLYFCNGMMEDILNHLVKINDLDVKSRTDVEPYRGAKKSRKDIAKELGVAYLLEGSVRKQGNSFRLMVQLIDAETGFHKWSQPYEGIYSDTIFIIQSEIAKKIAEALNAVITIEEKDEIEKLPTTDIRAYDYFIMAKQEVEKYWGYRDINSMKNAQELLDKALKIDPEFERALRTKGGTFLAFQQYDSVLKYADNILSINSKSAYGHHLKGEYYRFTSNAEPAIEAYKNALKYYSKNEIESIKQAEFFIGLLYCENLSDFKNGLHYIQKSDLSDPMYTAMIGQIFVGIGDYDKADKYFRKSLKDEILSINVGEYFFTLFAQSRFTEALNMLDTVCKDMENLLNCTKSRLYIHVQMKEFDKAQRDLESILNSGNTLNIFDSVWVAIIYKNVGREIESLDILKRSLISHKKLADKDIGFWSPFIISSIYSMLGEREKALDYLKKAFDIGPFLGMHDYIDIFPPFDSLRDDPEFKAIVKRAKDEKARLREEVKQMELRGEIDL